MSWSSIFMPVPTFCLGVRWVNDNHSSFQLICLIASQHTLYLAGPSWLFACSCQWQGVMHGGPGKSPSLYSLQCIALSIIMATICQSCLYATPHLSLFFCPTLCRSSHGPGGFGESQEALQAWPATPTSAGPRRTGAMQSLLNSWA